MTKMTYAEQLKHPNWQRKRLEMLELAEWECSECGCSDRTLHVHHKQYFKGRMAWEYESYELAVLCDECHKDEHEADDGLKTMLSLSHIPSIAALVAGFCLDNDNIPREVIYAARDCDPLAFAAGFIASLSYASCNIGQMDEVAALAAAFSGPDSEARMRYIHSPEIFGRS